MSRLGSLRIVIALALSITLVPVSARAEGFLGMIFNLFGGGRPPAQESAPPPPSASTPADLPGMHAPPSIGGAGGPQVAYCVRICDGRYFPLPKNAGGGNSTPAKICNAMCPAAETKIYAGSNIDYAVAHDGSRYSSLKNAYVYRERLVDGCGCKAGEIAGTEPIDISADPTLRPGDIVVTGDGPLVFKGSKGGKYQSGDFAPVANTKLSGTMREKVTGIKVAKPGAAPIASPQGFTPQKAAKPSEPMPEAASTEASPTAAAAQIFDFKDFDAAPRRAMGYSGEE